MKHTTHEHKPVRAIIWDYDVTLADTRQKNLMVTRKLVEQLTHKDGQSFPVLQSVAAYMAAVKKARNWRDFYRHELGLSEEQTDIGGTAWKRIQLQDETPVPLYEGIPDVLEALRHFPHGIVSQNGSNIISKSLRANGVEQCFRCIIGFEEVDLHKPKPEADGLLLCIRRLQQLLPGYIVYIGDHETDTQCVQNANIHLQKQTPSTRIISIGAFYGSGSDATDWQIKPDYAAHCPTDIVRIITQLERRESSSFYSRS